MSVVRRWWVAGVLAVGAAQLVAAQDRQPPGATPPGQKKLPAAQPQPGGLPVGAVARPGEKNRVRVVTWNKDGYLSSRGFEIDWDAPGRKEQQPIALHAVVVGVSQYAADALSLRFAAKDAADMARALELGGKSASVILDDADLAAAVKGTIGACFLNSGQTCSAHTRMLVPQAR